MPVGLLPEAGLLSCSGLGDWEPMPLELPELAPPWPPPAQFSGDHTSPAWAATPRLRLRLSSIPKMFP